MNSSRDNNDKNDKNEEKRKKRAVVGTGEESSLCDPGPELLLGGSARECSEMIINGMKKRSKTIVHEDMLLTIKNNPQRGHARIRVNSSTRDRSITHSLQK